MVWYVNTKAQNMLMDDVKYYTFKGKKHEKKKEWNQQQQRPKYPKL